MSKAHDAWGTVPHRRPGLCNYLPVDYGGKDSTREAPRENRTAIKAPVGLAGPTGSPTVLQGKPAPFQHLDPKRLVGMETRWPQP